MINYKKIFILIVIFISFNNLSFAEIPRYIDFKYLLNESIAGKKAQTFLKNKLEKGIKDIKSKSKEELENIVWELYVNYIVPQDTDKAQTKTLKRNFDKLEKLNIHFTDIDNQTCNYVNRKVYI